MSSTICWNCVHALEDKCEWFAGDKPVKGWNAIKSEVLTQTPIDKNRAVTSYTVLDCPKYEIRNKAFNACGDVIFVTSNDCKRRLRDKMNDYKYRVCDMANMLNLTDVQIYNRLNGRTRFTQIQINKICELLNIKKEERHLYFG